jgi:predicted DCC family thiol-disulfide oxidoreductase YuxK
MIYDGECAFCRRWIARWAAMTGPAIEYVAYQRLGDRFPEIERTPLRQAVHLVEPDGTVTRGVAAVFRALALAGRYSWLDRFYHRVPGFATISESLYRFVARRRGELDRLERAVLSCDAAPRRCGEHRGAHPGGVRV